MKALCYYVDNDYSIDVFMRKNEENRKESGARLFIKDMKQKKIYLPDGRIILVVFFDYAIPDVSPRWLAAIGLRQSLRNAGYKGKIKRADYRAVIGGLME